MRLARQIYLVARAHSTTQKGGGFQSHAYAKQFFTDVTCIEGGFAATTLGGHLWSAHRIYGTLYYRQHLWRVMGLYYAAYSPYHLGDCVSGSLVRTRCCARWVGVRDWVNVCVVADNSWAGCTGGLCYAYGKCLRQQSHFRVRRRVDL